MNDLYLIGNGFDLAHGLKTSYNDFLLWYLKRSISRFSPNKHFEDDLLIVDRPYNNPLEDHSSSGLFTECKRLQISIKYKHSFFQHIVLSYRIFKWVDIEHEYYLALVKLYEELVGECGNVDAIKPQVIELNNCLNEIKKKMVEYLSSIQISTQQRNTLFENILTEGTGPECQYRGEKLFLYFNYTSTLELYDKIPSSEKNKIVYIHHGVSR